MQLFAARQPQPERAIGLTQCGISYLHQACRQTLGVECHFWQKASQD